MSAGKEAHQENFSFKKAVIYARFKRRNITYQQAQWSVALKGQITWFLARFNIFARREEDIQTWWCRAWHVNWNLFSSCNLFVNMNGVHWQHFVSEIHSLAVCKSQIASLMKLIFGQETIFLFCFNWRRSFIKCRD